MVAVVIISQDSCVAAQRSNIGKVRMSIIVTGGAGFIGSNFIRFLMERTDQTIINLDKLTYAGNLQSLADYLESPRLKIVQGDILDRDLVKSLLDEYQPDALVNFAAESHVDRSIYTPEDFIQTNIVGTFRLLDVAKTWWAREGTARQEFRFLHISTDEVYGSLEASDPAFSEENPYEPNSPYSASKAASDHLVRAYFRTYGFPVLTTNCSNNYGPYQFPEKLIPLMIHRALKGEYLPVYGDGQNVRDWLYVADHCAAIYEVLTKGRLGETYNIGGNSEIKNIDVVGIVCDILDRVRPKSDNSSYKTQIKFVTDRPGHDRRYAINADKIRSELGWAPRETFASGIEKTVEWYLSNDEWVNSVTSGDYRAWAKDHYKA